MQEVLFTDLGQMEYQKAWDLQETLLQENLARKAIGGETVHRLLLVEHPPVYTLGKSGKMEHVLIDEAERAARGIAFFRTNRGGDITYHGPGQIVGYPLLDLEKFETDIGKYLRRLEETVIRTMAVYGLKGDRSAGETGVWLDPDKPGKERKICAIGVRCSRWLTMHGFAFNVSPDLSYFGHIVPCGIQQKAVTSLEKELGFAPDMAEVKAVLLREFEAVFDVQLSAAAVPVPVAG
ncbi:lipoyl(octanoyl) transferase LipB [Flavihumibacter petaseus]|uniref:Octanoyltransferase n=1 Tax=Flavihumibacter petaseus NBRC 106054 TaxID=1220578 RepID=A0A0E9N2P3_9BACT|nr:lipoyl(octanoyl) transferase LipB [Flavihumibacter petaseus]GAO43600.1 octanoyltransferase [Flavihumibacter petaseus NBRC 106054]